MLTMSTAATQSAPSMPLADTSERFMASLKSTASSVAEALGGASASLSNGSTQITSDNGLRLASHSSPLPSLKTPYVLEPDQGETHTLIGSGSIMRYLATAKVTAASASSDSEEEQVIGAAPEDGGFAVVQTRARQDEPVPAQ